MKKKLLALAMATILATGIAASVSGTAKALALQENTDTKAPAVTVFVSDPPDRW